MHLHLFEFEDLSWFPGTIREGATDYLRYFFRVLGFYKPVVPVLAQAMKESGETRILDLCSGGGGSIEQIYEGLKKEIPGLQISLSDKYPNVPAFTHLQAQSNSAITFIAASVDATRVPTELKGFRTMFTAVHHFKPQDVKAIIAGAVNAAAPIGIFDAGDKNIFSILGILIGHPLAFALWTPFFRPFRFSRLLFTYLLPLIPLMTVWDGLVSVLRLYSEKELLNFAKEAAPDNYVWKSGKVRNRFGLRVNYLVGYPKNR